MALVVADRVKETTTTSGTGTYDLGGVVTGFQSFATAIGNTNTTYYACTDGNNYEIGIGTYASTGNTLARTTILKSTNSNAAVNWGTSTKEIFVTYPAEKSVFKDASGDITGLTISTDVQAYDADLTALGGLAKTDSNFIVGNGSTWVAENGATARTSLGLGTAAVLDTGISNTNIAKFTSGVADNDFLRVDGTAIEGRSASEVLSDIGGQASLTFGKSDTNALKLEEAVAEHDILLAGSSNVKGRTYAELKSDLSLDNVENTALSTGTALNATHVTVTDNESTAENNLVTFVENAQDGTGNHGLEMDGNFKYNPSTGTVMASIFRPENGNQANIMFTNSDGQLCFGMDGDTSKITFLLDDEDGQPIFTFQEEDGTDILDGGDTDVTVHKPFIANSTITVGVNDTGHDVKFFGATSGKYMEWDESADQLDVTGSLDVTGNTSMVGTLTVGVDDTGHDVKFFGATSGKYMEWDESADQLNVSGTVDITGTVTADGLSVGDNHLINLGASNDMTLSHWSGNGVFENKTGSLTISQFVDNEDMILKCDDGSGGTADYIKLDGSEGEVLLSHYGNTKLATKSTGVDVTGALTVNGNRVNELIVASGSVSDVASIDFNSSIITTDFVGYRIELRNLIPETNNVSCEVRIGTANAALTSNNYRYTGAWAGGYQYGSSYWSGTTSSAGGDSFVLNANTYNLLGDATGENAYFNFVFPNASSTSSFKLMTACDSIIYGNYPMWQTTRFWGGVHALTTSRDAALNYITVFMSSDNIASADYRVYGII